MAPSANFQKLHPETWAQPLGELNFQRACRSEHEQWFWDSRPSNCPFAISNDDNRWCLRHWQIFQTLMSRCPSSEVLRRYMYAKRCAHVPRRIHLSQTYTHMRSACCALRPINDLSTGYGLRFSTEIYGSQREKPVFHGNLQEACFVLTEISENFRKPLGVYGICNLGILYSSSLLG